MHTCIKRTVEFHMECPNSRYVHHSVHYPSSCLTRSLDSSTQSSALRFFRLLPTSIGEEKLDERPWVGNTHVCFGVQPVRQAHGRPGSSCRALQRSRLTCVWPKYSDEPWIRLHKVTSTLGNKMYQMLESNNVYRTNCTESPSDVEHLQ